jgi:O-succinylbenzoate synthase
MVKVYQYSLPWNGTSREGLILQIGEGFGEIAPLPNWSRETFDEAKDELFSWIRLGQEPTLPSVRWGIECAKRPLNSVDLPLCALGPKKGFSTIKLKLGHLCVQDAIELVKNHLGHSTLRLDCNRAWSLQEALEFSSHFKKEDFAYIEEPVQNFEELIEFSKKTEFPIAVDESISCDLTKLPTLKAIVVKPTLVGFIPKDPRVVLSSSYESGLGLLHIANSASKTVAIGLDTYTSFQDCLLQTPISTSLGRFSWKKSTPLLRLDKLCAL